MISGVMFGKVVDRDKKLRDQFCYVVISLEILLTIELDGKMEV